MYAKGGAVKKTKMAKGGMVKKTKMAKGGMVKKDMKKMAKGGMVKKPMKMSIGGMAKGSSRKKNANPKRIAGPYS